MHPLRVLITQRSLRHRAGTELYAGDVASELQRRGHAPFVFSPRDGIVGDELRLRGIPTVDSLDRLDVEPDVIHGQHTVETLAALVRFPGVPAIYVCHDAVSGHDLPPRLARVRRYVAVDEPCYDKVHLEWGIEAVLISRIDTFVDLERFLPRPPLPEVPVRALLFSNSAHEGSHLPAVREACRLAGIDLDVAGTGVGTPCDEPEKILGEYDIVFAKGRCAAEAMAVGTAVIACDYVGLGGMVTAGNFDVMRRLNCGFRALKMPNNVDLIGAEIARYDRQDAADVSARMRSVAALPAAVDQYVRLYELAIVEQQGRAEEHEDRDIATSLIALGRTFDNPGPWEIRTQRAEEECLVLRGRVAEQADALHHSRSESTALRAELERLVVEITGERIEHRALRNTLPFRAREAILRVPLVSQFAGRSRQRNERRR